MVLTSTINLFNGRITELRHPECAEVIFLINNEVHKAYMSKQVYYYNARIIPEEDPLNKYIYVNMEVTFIGNIVKINGLVSKWVVIMCWPKEHSLGNKVDIKPGMIRVLGRIFNLEDNQGVLTADEYDDHVEVFFMLDKFFLYGKNLSSHPELVNQINVMSTVYFDAVPCIPKENKYNCKWCATCVYIGPKPTMDKLEPTDKISTKVLQIIQKNFNIPLCMYVIGKGKFLKSINDDFGLILAQFQDNLFKEILFHKKNAYVFNICMANEKLSNIFEKGDKMHFVAIAAKVNNFIDWIAVHVSVCDYGE
ncbi:uncharacterized protein LOC122519744 isoform X1 [Polistes fuscatus]|uniref:uncharacterized protein LOC122519744 isoform X1 n=1 Tax=Polistes fuscatus TaxID=30207 RepID=UPI001CA92A9A|nr:uncharacterized protein LOC122519744 isoform X1 [Polistes fuscatus]